MTNHISLDQPFTLNNGMVIKNRIVKAALSEVIADPQGNPDQRLINLYQRWGDGDIGLMISGNIMVDRRNIGESNNVVLDRLSDLSVFKKWTAAAKKKHTDIQFWAQLNHPGKQTPNFLTWAPVAPSAIPLKAGLRAGFNKPRALSGSEIENIINQFATSAELAKQVGFTGVQVHGAHGYLVSQFLSPLHNQRQDQWGGSLENRMRFLMQINRAIRNKVGDDFAVSIKLNSADFQKDGFSEEDYLGVVQALADAGINLLEISGGSYESQTMTGQHAKPSTQQREAYFIDYAEKVRQRVNVPILLTGGFRSAQGMLFALNGGATDLVGIGRAFCVYPDLAHQLIQNPMHRIELRTLSTGISTLDQMFVINISWYEHQLARLSQKLDTLPNMSAWRGIFKTIYNSGVYSVRKKRV